MSNSDQIAVEITDRVAPTIKVKLEQIGKAADSAQARIDELLKSQDGLSKSAVTAAQAELRLVASLGRTVTAENAAASSAQRLAQSELRTASAAAQAAAAHNRAEISALRLSEAQKKAAEGTDRSTSALTSFLAKAALLVGIGTGVAGIIELADSYTVLQNKLAPVEGSAGAAAERTTQLAAIATETRVPIDATAQAYSRFSRALQSIGVEGSRALPMTETVLKTLALSGTTATEAGSALLQLSQAFNKGKLDGDEFRTVMELMPVAADAIAKQMGVTRGELLKLAPQGKITSKIMLEAFESVADGVDQSFGKVVPTIDGHLTNARTNLTTFMGEINKGTGVFTGLTAAVGFFADNVKTMSVIALAAGVNLAWMNSAALVGGLGKLTAGVKAFSAAMSANPYMLAVTAILLLITHITELEDAFIKAMDLAEDFWESVFPPDAEEQARRTQRALEMSGVFARNDAFGRRIDANKDAMRRENDAFEEEQNRFLKMNMSWERAVASSEFKFRPEFDIGSEANAKAKAAYEAKLSKRLEGLGDAPKHRKAREGMSDEEKREVALAKINAQLDNQLARMQLLAPEREKAAQFDAIEEGLLGKKITLSDQETSAIQEKIAAIHEGNRLQAAMDDIYNDATGAVAKHNLTLQANAQLLKQGSISQQQHDKNVRLANIALEESTNLLGAREKALENEGRLLQFNARDRQIENELLAIENELLAKGVEAKEAHAIAGSKRGEYEQLRALREERAAEDAMLTSITDKQRELNLQTETYLKLRGQLANLGQDATTRMQIANDNGLDITGTGTHFDAMVEAREQAYARIEELRQREVLSEQEASVAKMRIWNQEQKSKLDVASTFFSSFTGLAQSENKEIAAIGKAAAIANATISTYEAANEAYAAMAGIPVVGPALGAAAAAGAIASGMVNVAAIASTPTGFKAGGYTGNIPANDVAGVVHGREYVMDAASTARLGRHNLDALRSGDAGLTRGASSGGGGGAPAPITVIIVQSKEEALAALASKEGQVIMVENVGKNARAIARQIRAAS